MPTLDTSHTFPYSSDKDMKRQQIWDNLQKGILFEDSGVFISWWTPFAFIDKYAEQRRDRGDRTNWFLGNHKILDGYSCNAEVMKWLYVDKANPVSQIEEWLGVNEEGNAKFLFLKNKLTDLLGEPSAMNLEKFGAFDLGSVEWVNQKIRISLTGIEQFELKYRVYIGLIDNKNRV
jgi:hypothetical protein